MYLINKKCYAQIFPLLIAKKIRATATWQFPFMLRKLIENITHKTKKS